MKRLLLLSIALLFAVASGAQETHRFAQRDTCDLYLDIWRSDSLSKPAVLYVFGGGFVAGKRNDPYVADWFKRLNTLGYSVVSIDYRLGMKGYKIGKGLSSLVKASDRFYLSQQIGVEDVYSALSFLYEHPELGIDVNNIVISGSSAGAIISLASAYDFANGKRDGLPEGFKGFRGVMSFAGGIISTSGAPRFKQVPCPLLLFHGTADKAVAYNNVGAFGRGLWGSNFIAKQFKRKGWDCCIYRFKDRPHSVAAYMKHLLAYEEAFLEKVSQGAVGFSLDATIDDKTLPSFWNISTKDIYK